MLSTCALSAPLPDGSVGSEISPFEPWTTRDKVEPGEYEGDQPLLGGVMDEQLSLPRDLLGQLHGLVCSPCVSGQPRPCA